jgi:hypothetical protein
VHFCVDCVYCAAAWTTYAPVEALLTAEGVT